MKELRAVGFNGVAIADHIPQMVWSTLPDGYHDYYSQLWYEFTGVPEGSTDGEAWNDMFHPDDGHALHRAGLSNRVHLPP